MVPFSSSIDESEMPGEVDEIIDAISRQQEIQKLSHDLKSYGISFAELAKTSPGQEKTRRHALTAANYLVSDNELKQYLQEKKRLPLSLMESRYNINRKFLDRYRKYIITTSLIIMGEYTYLKQYLGREKGAMVNE